MVDQELTARIRFGILRVFFEVYLWYVLLAVSSKRKMELIYIFFPLKDN